MNNPDVYPRRTVLPEQMDQPGVSEDALRHALAGLRRINRISLATRRILSSMRQFTDADASVLDIACGGGDMLLALAREAARRRQKLRCTGLDAHPDIIRIASANAAKHLPGAEFICADALSASLPACDFALSTLFLHHLRQQEAVVLLQKMCASARYAVIIDDLLRSVPGYVLALAGTRLLSRSSIVHSDGPLSVRNAFTLPEVRRLLHDAGIEHYHLRRCWPERFHLVIPC